MSPCFVCPFSSSISPLPTASSHPNLSSLTSSKVGPAPSSQSCHGKKPKFLDFSKSLAVGGIRQLDKESHPQGEGNLPGLEGKGPPGQVTSHPWEEAEAWEDEEWVEGIIYLLHGGTFESQVTGINHLVTGVKGVMAERYTAQLQ